MRSHHLPMTVEEFRRLPQKLGWKCEYWNGAAHISPRSVSMWCAMPVVARPVSDRALASRVTPDDFDALRKGYLAAFGDSIEYCDWPEEEIVADAERNLRDFFAGRGGAPLAASQVIRERSGADARIVGACLLVEVDADTAMLDLLYVTPKRHRRGLASVMGATALTELAAMGFGTLQSRYLLGNAASRAWHHRFGFRDHPDFVSARIMRAHFHEELERQCLLGSPDPGAVESLLGELRYWDAEVRRLDRFAEETGTSAILGNGRRGGASE